MRHHIESEFGTPKARKIVSRSRLIAVIGLLSVVELGSPRAGAAQERSVPVANASTKANEALKEPCAYDVLAPRNLVRVVERRASMKDRAIHDGALFSPAPCKAEDVIGAFDPEVDLRSAVVVLFRRDYLRALEPRDDRDATLSIRATYIRDGKENPLEVQSFYKIGQATKQNSIASRSIAPYLEALADLAVIRLAATDNGPRSVRRLLEAGNGAIAKGELGKLIEERAKQSAAYQEAHSKRLALLTIPTVDSAQLLAAQATERAAGEAFELAKLREEQADKDLAVAKARLRGEVNQLAADSARLLNALKRLQSATGQRGSQLRRVLGPRADVLSFQASRAEAIARDLFTTAALARVAPAAGAVAQLAGSDSAFEETRRLANDLFYTLQNLSEALPSATLASAQLTEDALRNLPDGTIDLPSSPLEDGDRIRILVEVGSSSVESDGEVPRTFVLNLTARAFGVRWSLSDAAVLLKRRAQDSQADAYRSTLTPMAPAGTQRSFATDVNFQPTAGVLWAARPTVRRAASGRSPFRSFVRTVEPSLGLHVAAPQFNTRVVKIEDGKVIDSVENSKFDLGVGLGLGLFAERIHLVVGLAPTAQKKRGYFALGLSFARLVDGRLSFSSN